MDALQERQRRTDHWHFEKRLSLDTLVAVAGISIVLGGPIFYWGRAMEQRVQTLEIRAEASTKQDTARQLDARDERIAILTKMEKLDEQVTQLRIEVGALVKVKK